MTLAETGAITEYILAKYDGSNSKKLVVPPTADNYADYLYYLHFTNGTLQPALLTSMALTWYAAAAGAASEPPGIVKLNDSKVKGGLDILEERLASNTWLAGEDFTLADIVIVFSLTTMNAFQPFYNVADYPAIASYLKRVGQREGYIQAMEKGDGAVPKLG